MVNRNLKIIINREQVLKQIECRKESDLYEEVLEEYQEIEALMYSLCEPIFLVEQGFYEGKPVLMVLYSIGRKISDYATTYFQNGDYLKGMLADAMADSALLSLEKASYPYVKELCVKLKRGIQRRLEIPQDIPMEVQQLIFDTTRAEQNSDIKITKGYMLDPIKSNAILYELTTDQESFCYLHDCSSCGRKDCKMRSAKAVPVEAFASDKKICLFVEEKESILDALVRTEPSYHAVCGGNGLCGKCQICVVKGTLDITECDKNYFTEDELLKGKRLACQAYPTQTLQIELLFENEKQFKIVSKHKTIENKTIIQQEQDFGIVADIGTTTIVVQLISVRTGKTLQTYTAINSQRRYGADVISRIKASVEGKQEILGDLIRDDIRTGIHTVVNKAGISTEKIRRVVFAGNTAMIHLLMKYECTGLGIYPFIPVNIRKIEIAYEELFQEKFLNAIIQIVPGISAFVGGDIVSGIVALGVHQKKEYSLLLDFGTNGEIVLGNKEKILVTSTAAGPAFEGGNIQWGTGSIAGAISGVTIENDKSRTEKELIVFRDSYASSLIPLLVSEYSKITMIDTRYISPKILSDYIDFEGKDILFMYSTMVINNSISLK